jgi:hypothetical protein
MRSIVLVCREYWNKTNGFTTQSTEIVIDGEPAGKIRGDYYGTQYVYEAMRYLDKEGKLPKPYKVTDTSIESPFRYCEENGIRLYYTTTKVARKSDL